MCLAKTHASLADDKRTLLSMDGNLEMVREGREPSGPRGPSQLTELYTIFGRTSAKILRRRNWPDTYQHGRGKIY
jgi:hypothetical protein